MNESELFTKAPIRKAYFSLTLPLVFGMVITLIYNLADTFFIGQTGDTNQVAAVALCAPIFSFLIAVGDIFGLGGSSTVSRAFGAKDDEKAKRIFSFCFYASIIFGIFISLVLFFGSPIILNILGTSEQTHLYAEQYLKICALGAPFVILSYTPMNILRSEGFAKASVVGSSIGIIINIILDPVFILGMNMGVKGAAIATVIGNVATNIFYVIFIIKKSRKFSLNIKWFSAPLHMVKEILLIGIPASLTNIMQSVANVITNRCLLEYGDIRIASMGVAIKANLIVILILVGFAFGIQPLIGYNYGAKNYERLKEAIKFSMIFEFITACVLSVIVAITAKPLVQFFIDDAEIIKYGTVMLRILMISGPLVAVGLVCTVIFQALGKAGSALVLSIGRQGIIFIPVIYILKAVFGYYGVLYAQPIADVVMLFISFIMLAKIYKSFELESAL